MADKQVTVAVPEERVPEFYAWFAAFLASEPGAAPPFGGRGRRGPRGSPAPRRGSSPGRRTTPTRRPGSTGKLAPPARELFDLLAGRPGARFGGEEIASASGSRRAPTASRASSPGPAATRRHLGRMLPIATEGRADGGTDYYMDPETATLFTAARDRAAARDRPAAPDRPRREHHRRTP